ncbi:MAG: UDP-N-acetylmuramoyl-tripeptide--D-alanyl-D-alanine ligase [candidate division NC10 bacterium]|nr:UDP-N-acetylmuramoyl-tripeptide--D-alanyl-D-alanine ligase [candidate division NC10 bacterium]
MRDSVSVAEILEATGGRLLLGAKGARVQTFSTDTRTLRPRDLFIALQGANFDGHQFVAEAFRKGACGAVISSPSLSSSVDGGLLLQVEDTLFALGEIARLWRRLHPIPLVAVTGSAGKTTTKEWAAALLGRRFRVLSSPGTYNNRVGVPLTLLQLRKDHQLAVLELGTSAPGEIRRLSQICQPDMGLITNIGPAHLQFLSSLEGVARAKAEMLEFLTGERTCILNADDPHLAALLGEVRGRRFTYGLSPGWDLSACGIRRGEEGIACELSYQGERIPLHLPLWGRHSVYNALGSGAIGILCGLDLREVAEGLSAMRGTPMRLERTLLPGGFVLLNDAYNANPLSMRVALDTFFEMKGEARGILVLGDMLELGPQTEALHREIGALLPFSHRVGGLIAVGVHSHALADEAIKRGFSAPIFLCRDMREASRALKESLKPGDWILLKGSRAMKMEEVLEGLL